MNKQKVAYMECGFDIFYLTVTFIIGLILLIKGAGTSAYRLPGIMALTLVIGDSFHLIPRILTALSNNEDKYFKQKGIGKQITSITMTFFYIILWHIGLHYTNTVSSLTYVIYILAIIRIVLCLLPQNKWTSKEPPVKMGIIRNIPFTIMGLIIAWHFLINTSVLPNALNLLWLAIVISFGCYLPVVLYAHKKPMLGMLMIPKTCAYMWMIIMFLFV